LILVEEKRAAEAMKYEMAEGLIAQNLASEERREQVNDEFDKVLKSKGDVSAVLARYKLKWQDLGAIPVTQNYIDKIEAGEQIIEAALNVKPGQIHPALVRAGSQAYVVRLKDFTVASEKADAKKMNTALAKFSGGGETLGLWADELRKASRIRLNDSILK
jgi:hypothetical protein